MSKLSRRWRFAARKLGRSTGLIVIAALLFLANVVINLFSTAIESPLKEQIGAGLYPSVLAVALVVCLGLAAAVYLYDHRSGAADLDRDDAPPSDPEIDRRNRQVFISDMRRRFMVTGLSNTRCELVSLMLPLQAKKRYRLTPSITKSPSKSCTHKESSIMGGWWKFNGEKAVIHLEVDWKTLAACIKALAATIVILSVSPMVAQAITVIRRLSVCSRREGHAPLLGRVFLSTFPLWFAIRWVVASHPIQQLGRWGHNGCEAGQRPSQAICD